MSIPAAFHSLQRRNNVVVHMSNQLAALESRFPDQSLETFQTGCLDVVVHQADDFAANRRWIELQLDASSASETDLPTGRLDVGVGPMRVEERVQLATDEREHLVVHKADR